ncbi:SRPBCC family protein [Streptomyces sp. NPDC091383]|uniref:SRPBCC family protein n=1 Tax=Streptomyces sp. NPDC091383 TaxID=3365996 RepID=UPI003810E46E
MRPVTVSTEVPYPPARVHDFLEVMAHHERFTDHYLTDWRYSGPSRGYGARATVTAALGGTRTDVGIEVINSEPPYRIVEHNTSAAGRRQAHGIYTIAPLPDGGGSRVSFTYTWLRAPLPERLLAPVVRATMRRANHTVMRRLAAELARYEDGGGGEDGDGGGGAMPPDPRP